MPQHPANGHTVRPDGFLRAILRMMIRDWIFTRLYYIIGVNCYIKRTVEIPERPDDRRIKPRTVCNSLRQLLQQFSGVFTVFTEE
ncbi:MAG: hypothetical protein BLM47_05415 [Candidatus Reconcilbacillus cellulovorans]|uniref:Uncharacterized protein n=1 Tax=Candidatus Reconcilbacillus cellulovorans TaxID=1906605 RepID=A0A2A6E1G4_9BACL|nr:MAG: hypothetical protein BLM47_05415 [Candidatus Reconcilbacillus cellulovorans]